MFVENDRRRRRDYSGRSHASASRSLRDLEIYTEVPTNIIICQKPRHSFGILFLAGFGLTSILFGTLLRKSS